MGAPERDRENSSMSRAPGLRQRDAPNLNVFDRGVGNGTPNDVVMLWVLFVNHPDAPEVEVRQYKGKSDTGIAQVFNNPSNDPPDGVAEASVIYGRLIAALHDLLIKREDTTA